MSKFSIFFLLIASISLARCVPLENLCTNEGPFYTILPVYKNLTINGFYRIPYNVTFPPVEYFLIPRAEDCLQSRFFNISHRDEALEVKEF